MTACMSYISFSVADVKRISTIFRNFKPHANDVCDSLVKVCMHDPPFPEGVMPVVHARKAAVCEPDEMFTHTDLFPPI